MEKLKKLTVNFMKINLLSLIALFVFILLASFFEIYPVIYMQQILDGLTQNFEFAALILLLGYWYGCRLLEAFFSALSGRVAAFLSSKYSKQLRRTIFSQIIESTYSITEDKSAAEGIYTSIDDVNSLGTVILSPIQYMAQNLAVFIWASVYLIRLDFLLYLACVPLGIVMWLAGNVVSKKNKINEEAKKTSESGVAETISSFFLGSRDILTTGLDNRFNNAFSNFNENLCARQYKSSWLNSALSSLLDILWPVATVISLGLGGYRMLTGNLSIGGLVAFMWYIQWAINPVSQFAVYKNQIQTATVAYERISKLIETYGNNTRCRKYFSQEITNIVFDNVSYKYKNGGRGVDGISVSFHRGVFYSIVGKTGSGKSTIGKLINGLYKPLSGTIKINGGDMMPNSILGSRQIMSAYSDPYIFSGSIVDNITLFTENEKIQADRLENIFSILRLNDLRLADNLSDQGEHGLSTGQRQRIAIGRLLYQNPDVIIIDEATSSIDSNTEKAILDKLTELSSDHIVILISHRLSSVLKTDHCYMINDGRIVCQGNPLKLLDQSADFKELFVDQI